MPDQAVALAQEERATGTPGVTTRSGIQLQFRPSVESDTPAVNSAFLRGLRDSSYTHGLPSDTFFAVGRQAWAGIQRDFITTIAHPVDQPDEIAGYITHADFDTGGRAVAWIYVARPWRKFGIAGALLAEAGIKPRERFAVLFATPQKLALARSKGYQPAFLPFLCWRWLVESDAALPSLAGLEQPE
ncbi:MAG: hypothetical protein ABJA82_00675 [Myxococcales bacterium]